MDIKDMQIQILGQTIGNLHVEISELRATVIVQNNQLKKLLEEIKEVQDGSNKDSTAN